MVAEPDAWPESGGAMIMFAPKVPEFGSETALGVNFEIEESGCDGSACAKGEQHDKKAAGIGAEEALMMRQNMARLLVR